MSKNLTLTDTAIHACVVLSNAIDSLAEDMQSGFTDLLPETRGDLCAAYAALCEVLSRELRVDANVMIQQMIGADLMATRAILTAQTGIKFPVLAEK